MQPSIGFVSSTKIILIFIYYKAQERHKVEDYSGVLYERKKKQEFNGVMEKNLGLALDLKCLEL